MQSQQPEQQKNLILAIVLSMAVVFGWQYFYAGPKMKEEQERLKRQQAQSQPIGASPGTAASPVPGVAGAPAIPGAVTAPPAVSREQALAASPRVAIETPSIKGSISLKGARIDDVSLVKYRETVVPNSPNIKLLSPADAPEPYFAEHGWVGAPGVTQKMPDRDTLWTQAKPGALTPGEPVTLTWDNGQGLKFNRTIAVDANFMFVVTDTVENTSSADVTLYPYARIFRLGTPVVQGFYILHEGPIGFVGEAGLQELGYADLLKDGGGKTIEKAGNGWLGFTDKYWAAALVPAQGDMFTANFRGNKKVGAAKESFQTDYTLAAQTIPAGQKKTVEGRLFAGAKEVQLINSYTEDLKINRFDLMIDWGFFHFITKPLYKLIHWLAQVFGNFGLAILAVTVLVKGAFFPLANKSYASMAKMKKLQPEMEKLRERFKDDKAGMQKELMGLYQKEKINPMAGCLPVLLQVPVFFALYKVLFVTIDMRHAPFFGWIKDLSAPDPTSLFNLFGLLPFAVPEFLHIGVWPLIMGVTMWVQMQLNPKQPDPVQQMVFNWMPVMFTFMLGSFPAGLVIYWAWNNLLSILQQSLIMKRQGVDVPLLENMGLSKLFGGVPSAPPVSEAKPVVKPAASNVKPTDASKS
jgi:YidC/Oxa1 family membrane protein insertase